MSRKSTKVLKFALSSLYYSKGYKALAPFTQGVGVIFMLHHVRPEPAAAFEPNRILKVTPEFLEGTIRNTLDAGYEIVSLDEAHWRLMEGDFESRFACFTFDDGYRDNWTYAYPIFSKYNLPFTIYVPSDYADGHGELWWLVLERVIAEVDRLTVRIAGEDKVYACQRPVDKDATYHEIYWWLRSIDEDDARAFVNQLASGIAFDPKTLCQNLVMPWDELAALNRDPLVTIGAHTKGHYALAKLTQSQMQSQVSEGIERIAHHLGERPVHFSYPYGCENSAGPREFRFLEEVGVKTAVTTRKGVVHAAHSQFTTALPRISLNGDYQDQKYVSVLLTGSPFAFWNGFRKVNVA